MDAGKPDPDEARQQAQSLSQRFAVALRGVAVPGGGWRLAAAVGAFVALGPVVTIAGAMLLTRHERGEAAKLQAELAPRLATERVARDARAELGRAAARPAMGVTLDLLAGALPSDAALTRAERTRQDALELDIATPDPDALRAAVRRAPEFARLRDTSQRRTDAAMIVSMREEEP